MARRYFGTDGVRGTVGQYPITPDFVVLLGQAAGRVLREQLDGRRPTVLIGKDPRISGYMLEAALQAGFLSAGADVLLCGPIPTPAVAYLTRALRLDAGVVISASHNPYTLRSASKTRSIKGRTAKKAITWAKPSAWMTPWGAMSSFVRARSRKT